METFESHTFARPDETLSMERTTIDLVGLAGGETHVGDEPVVLIEFQGMTHTEG
jgi:hypothetical protein